MHLVHWNELYSTLECYLLSSSEKKKKEEEEEEKKKKKKKKKKKMESCWSRAGRMVHYLTGQYLRVGTVDSVVLQEAMMN